MKKTVLLAEDNPDHAALLRMSAQRYGHQIELKVVHSGSEMLAAVRAGRYDCVVIDFFLGDYDADELLKEGGDALRSIPVLVNSGCADETVARRASDAGCAAFIPKSTSLVNDDLWDAVLAVLGDESEPGAGA